MRGYSKVLILLCLSNDICAGPIPVWDTVTEGPTLLDTREREDIADIRMMVRGFPTVVYKYKNYHYNHMVALPGKDVQDYIERKNLKRDTHPELYSVDYNGGQKNFGNRVTWNHHFQGGRLWVWYDYEKAWPANPFQNIIQEMIFRKRRLVHNVFKDVLFMPLFEDERMPDAHTKPGLTFNAGIEGKHLDNPLVEATIGFLATRPVFKTCMCSNAPMLRADFGSVEVNMIGHGGEDLAVCIPGCIAGSIAIKNHVEVHWTPCSQEEILEGF